MLKSCYFVVFLFFLAFAISAEQRSLGEKEYTGKTVNIIYLDIGDVFEEEDLSLIYKSANQFKVKTKEKVILRELAFKAGDRLTPLLIAESSRNLRTLKFVRKVKIIPFYHDADSVNVLVKTQDTWTLIPQFSYSSGDGREKRAIGITESNIAGLGKRLEFLLEDDSGTQTFQSVYDDRRFFGTSNRMVLSFFDRQDGEKGTFSFNKPLRTLFDDYGYGTKLSYADTAEQLYRNAKTRYVFRRDLTDTSLFYTFAEGNPEIESRRYSFGYEYHEATFEKASQKDLDDLSLREEDLALEDIALPDNRRFSGPFISYQSITPEYISKDYIDRFDWVSDYNLGNQYAAQFQYAPEVMGSLVDASLFSGTFSTGHAFSNKSFLRGELSFGSRYQEGGFQNSLLHHELRFYNVLGQRYFGETYLGRHTLAAGLTFDYAKKLDRDNEFLLGADNFLRGYDARTFSGDKFMAINLEDRAHLFDDILQLFSVGTVLFFDAGAATNENLTQMLGNEIYSDVGIGLRLGFPRSSGARVVRLDIAVPLRDGPDGSSAYTPRFLASVSQVFDSFLRSEVIRKKSENIDTGF